MALTYKDILTSAMEMLGHHPDTFLVGYNTSHTGGSCGGTSKSFPQERVVEMPLAENSMTGAAVGLALDGWIPILWFERMDFILLALDPLVNHLCKLDLLSGGLHKPALIIRCAVGNKQMPLYTGPTHTQNFSNAIRELVNFKVVELKWPSGIVSAYAKALEDAQQGRSTMLVEFRDLYPSV